MPLHTEQQLSSTEIFSGKVFRVTLDNVRLENGNTAQREVVHHTGGAGIVALNENGEIALVRQYRYAQNRELLEIPAGKIEPGEAPLATAARELREEAGCTAAAITDLGSIIPTCAYCTEVIYLFLATGLSAAGQQLDVDEFLDVLWLPLSTAVDMVLDGRITDAKTVAALLKIKLLRDTGAL